jgi:secondary thiamine-phosphate synthase enzyme
MKVCDVEIEFRTEERFEAVDLTKRVREAVNNSSIKEGFAMVYTDHTTGALILNEYEASLLKDLKNFLGEIFPLAKKYHHSRNAYAHLSSILLTNNHIIPINSSGLELGTWQSIYWVEGENRPRNRTVKIKVLGD